jgi:5-methylcytosine-specific restriction endonuclease McrA
MKKRTKALQIPADVKRRVWERDRYCVYCGSPNAAPVAHYIARSQGGLGIEENILTLCQNCHRRYDQSGDRQKMRAFFREYLSSKYPEWNEENLHYRR